MATFSQIATRMALIRVPVIPVQPKEKRCILTGWQNQATTDAAKIAEWNAENPKYNVGCVAKPDGIWILDDDSGVLLARKIREDQRNGKPVVLQTC
jgi:Bifunctional DNA primase/polymerase, N-terminal